MSEKEVLEKCKNYLRYAMTDASGNRVIIVREDDLKELLRIAFREK